MGAVLLIFSMTLGVIVFSSYWELWKRQEKMLRQYASLYTLEQVPENKGSLAPVSEGEDPPPGEGPDYRLSTFYSVALDGEQVLAVDDGGKDVYSEKELIRIAKEMLTGNKTFGRRKTLACFIEKREEYTLVAFMDNTLTDRGMQTLLRYVLLAGGPAILALFCVSAFLSRSIVRPLEENDRKQRQFISDAGHELKTPVAVIRANAELLQGEKGENPWLANIQYENERMGELVKQLLALSKAENTQGAKEAVDFSHAVMGESLAFEKGKVLESRIEEGIVVFGHGMQLSQLAAILLDNAISHSTGKEIFLSVKRQKHRAVLQVINEGDAIAPETAKHLFDRFYRADTARSGEGHHYGLGLSIAKAVVKNHGGSISLSYREGKVECRVLLPINGHPLGPAV